MGSQTVQLLVTCLVDVFAPEVGRATIRTLNLAGCEVEFPASQTCCGQPAFNVGMWDDARAMAAHTLDVLDATSGTVVVPSGSCAVMVAKHYQELFAGSEREEQAVRVSSRVRELSQFLVDDLEVVGFDSVCDDCTFTVHKSCHGLRGLGLDDQVETLVGAVAGSTTLPLDGADECCGFGGLFSVEMPEVSAAIMNTKLDRVEASGAKVVVGGDISCLLHIEGGLRRRGSGVSVRHFVEVIGGSDAT